LVGVAHSPVASVACDSFHFKMRCEWVNLASRFPKRALLNQIGSPVRIVYYRALSTTEADHEMSSALRKRGPETR
jgi:hypothetical protein